MKKKTLNAPKFLVSFSNLKNEEAIFFTELGGKQSTEAISSYL